MPLPAPRRPRRIGLPTRRHPARSSACARFRRAREARAFAAGLWL